MAPDAFKGTLSARLVAEAIGAAIADAVGVVMPRLPFLPERIMEAIDAAGGARR